jgi:hypothetical protein
LNRYYQRSHIFEKKFKEIIKYFALDLTANRTTLLSGLTQKLVIRRKTLQTVISGRKGIEAVSAVKKGRTNWANQNRQGLAKNVGDGRRRLAD